MSVHVQKERKEEGLWVVPALRPKPLRNYHHMQSRKGNRYLSTCKGQGLLLPVTRSGVSPCVGTSGYKYVHVEAQGNIRCLPQIFLQLTVALAC